MAIFPPLYDIEGREYRLMGWFYQSVKWSGRAALPIFFGNLEVTGREHIPNDQPYLLAPNHQNAFIDAILVGVYSPKEVCFLTRSDVFVAPFDRVLAALNMIPVYRIRDGYDQLKKNEVTFAICDEKLKNDQPVLIFPEGNMDLGFHLRKTSKGTARMAIQSQAKLEKELVVIPVGINYNHHDYPRRGAHLNYGTPIPVRSYIEAYADHPARGILKLKKEIEAGIHSLLLLPNEEDFNNDKKPILNRKYMWASFQKKKELLDTGVGLHVSHPSLMFRPFVWLFTLANLIPHGILYQVITSIEDPQFKLSLKYLLGLLLFPLWWIIVGIVVGITIDWQWAGIVTLGCIASLWIRSYFHNLIR